jgi:hypothetical protein
MIDCEVLVHYPYGNERRSHFYPSRTRVRYLCAENFARLSQQLINELGG